jgi:hypothetical protein
VDRPVLALDRDRPGQGAGDRRRDVRLEAGRGQHGLGALVDAGPAHQTALGVRDLERVAGHPGPAGDRDRQRHRVAADVVDRTAGQRRVPQPAGAGGRGEAEAGVHAAHGADPPALDRGAQRVGERGEPELVGLDHRQAGLGGDGQHVGGALGGGGERLLAQHGPTGAQGRDRLVGVGGVHARDVDGVHVRPGEHLGGGAGGGDALLGGERPRAVGVGAGDRDHLGVGHGREGRGEDAGDLPGAQDCPSGGAHVRVLPFAGCSRECARSAGRPPDRGPVPAARIAHRDGS